MPPPEIVEAVEPGPIDIAAIAVMEPVMNPAVTEDVVLSSTATITELDADPNVIAASVEAPPPLPVLEILSLERIDRSTLPARRPRSWRYSISRWAYRWWLWTREAFRQCFPASGQPSSTCTKARNAE